MNGRSIRFLCLFSLLGLFFLTGCNQTPDAPDPALTAVGGAGGGSDSADWISPADVDRADSLGLPMRDGEMTAAALGQGNQIENMFEPIYFEFDQSFIRPEDRPVLQEAAQYLFNNAGADLLIEGHCDWRGTTEYNMALGDRRANSVKAYLTQLGVSPDRIETVSKGDLEAVTEGSDAEMQDDRRADLIVIP